MAIESNQSNHIITKRTWTFLAVTKQLYEWFSLSVCPPIRLSFTPFSCSHHHIIMTFWVIFIDRSDVVVQKVKVRGQMSSHRGQNKFRAFLECNSSLNWLMATKWCIKLEVTQKRCTIVFQGHLRNFKVTQDKKFVDFYQNWAFPDSLKFEFTDSCEMMDKAWISIK